MVFWTMLFLGYNIFEATTGGRWISNPMIEWTKLMIATYGREEKDFDKAEKQKLFSLIIKLTLIVIGGIIYMLAFLIYLANAITIEGASIATVIMCFIFLSQLIKSSLAKRKVKKERTLEDYYKTLHNFESINKGIWRWFIKISYIAYFTFMLIVLI